MMKKITVDGPVTLNLEDKSLAFTKGRVYEVEDAVAAHPYLKQYIVRCEDVEQAVKPARKTAPKAKKEAEDGKSDATGA